MSLPLSYARRTAAGTISHACLAPPPPFRRNPTVGCSPAMKRGLKFEAHVNKRLTEDLLFHKLILQPHLRFDLNGSMQSAFPDALIQHNDEWILVEIKLRHTYDGYNQLTHLYYPVLRKIFPEMKIRRLEICKTYDPFVQLPEKVVLEKDLYAFLDRKDDAYGVLIWR